MRKMGSIHHRLLQILAAQAVCFSASSAFAESSQEAASNHVRAVNVRVTDSASGATEVEVVGTSAPLYAVRIDSGGKRLLVDLQSADIDGVKDALTRTVGVVGGVMTQAYQTDAGRMTRLFINLNHAATYRVRPDGNSLKLVLVPGPSTVPAEPAQAERAHASSANVTGAASSKLTDLRYERAKAPCASQCDRVLLSLSEVPSYSLVAVSPSRLRLELRGAVLPTSLARTLDVSQSKGALRSVTARFDDKLQATVIELDKADPEAQGTVSVEGKTLVWSFDPSSSQTVTLTATGQPLRKSVTVARETVSPEARVETSILGDDTNVETVSGSQSAAFTATLNGQVRGYSGKRINLDFKDVDIHNILRMLADVGRVNIIAADDVTGNVTIKMGNVPWDQALDVVLQSKALGMVRTGNLIRVAPLAVLQKERELRLAAAKQEYELTPLETRLIPVSYARAEELQTRAKDLLSPRGSIAVDERTNVMIARDVSGNLNNVEELVRSLDTQTPQVLVEARIVEAQSRYLRDVGIQWGGDATFSEATGNPTGIAFPSRLGMAGGSYDQNTNSRGLSPFQSNVAQPNFAVNLPAATGTGQGGAIGFSLGSIDRNFNVGIRLSAAEASGLVRIVSSPRVLTLDNREARISSGTLIPFAQISAQGVQTTFQEAKLQLLVRPHVTAEGSVAMHLKINRDEPDFTQTSPRGDPTIYKREAETDLLVMDGHTAVIGGIFTRNTGRNLDQVPFFGDIPILGVLFQRRKAVDVRNELVIFITPRIVNRAETTAK